MGTGKRMEVDQEVVMNMSEATSSQPDEAHVYCGRCGRRRSAASEDCTYCQARHEGPVREDPIWLSRMVACLTRDGDDLMDGQGILVTARWILVGAGLLLALWNPDALGELKVEIGLILTLAVANFFLHVQMLREQPPLKWVAYLASGADIVAITAIVIVSGGADSGLYTFYFPALIAIAVAFPVGASLVLSAGAIGLYGLVLSTGMGGSDDPLLVVRLVMMVAVVACGIVYRNIERQRRREAGESL